MKFLTRVLFLIFLMGFTTLTVSAEEPLLFPEDLIEVSQANTSEITIYASDIRWRYKTVNNKLYKRQYNYTRNVWIGNWVPA